MPYCTPVRRREISLDVARRFRGPGSDPRNSKDQNPHAVPSREVGGARVQDEHNEDKRNVDERRPKQEYIVVPSTLFVHVSFSKKPHHFSEPWTTKVSIHQFKHV